ncbi:MAG: DUF11 domain-containing protein [Ectothiorhodospiraceae bacterium]|nr:DUF11 domain-containing protein [Ectothiorhodospiraceae bacterium]
MRRIPFVCSSCFALVLLAVGVAGQAAELASVHVQMDRQLETFTHRVDCLAQESDPTRCRVELADQIETVGFALNEVLPEFDTTRGTLVRTWVRSRIGGGVRYTFSGSSSTDPEACTVGVLDVLHAGTPTVFVCAVSALHSGCVSTPGCPPGRLPGSGDVIEQRFRADVVEEQPVEVVIEAGEPLVHPGLTLTSDIDLYQFVPSAGVVATYDLEIDTSVEHVYVPFDADLELGKSGPNGSVAPGASVEYVLTVVNHGPGTAREVVVTDFLPEQATYFGASGSGWDCTHDAGAVTCVRPTLTADAVGSTIAIVVSAPTEPGTMVNFAQVSAATPDPAPGNDADSETTGVVATSGAAADLAITIDDSNDPVRSGELFEYQVSVANAGLHPASDILVHVELSPGVRARGFSGDGWTCANVGQLVTCERDFLDILETLEPGVAPLIRISATAPDAPGAILATARVSSAELDLSLDDNVDDEVTEVGAATSLERLLPVILEVLGDG